MDDELYFKNRQEAGRILADKLKTEKDDFIVVGLPRGGILVAKEVAKALNAPLDFLVVKKIGHPFNPEFALGAISENGAIEVNKSEALSVDEKWLSDTIVQKESEAMAQSELYGKSCPHKNLADKTVIIVDDGLATGLTMLVAIEDIKRKNPKRIIIAVPVAPPEIAEQFEKKADEFIAVSIPKYFMGAVGAYYDEFEQVSEEDVATLLKC